MDKSPIRERWRRDHVNVFCSLVKLLLLVATVWLAAGYADAQQTQYLTTPTPAPAAVPVVKAERTDINDLARFLAGIQPTGGGRLAALAQTPEWIAYSNSLYTRWLRFDINRLRPIRAWSAEQLADVPTKTLFYPFSGPDFIYAATFFPKADTYILCGLEPVGDLPSLEKLEPINLSLGWLQASMKTILEAGYFVTKDMNVELKLGPLQGTLPIILVMMARSGNTITSIRLDSSHVEIRFTGADGGKRTLHYFSTDLSNAGLGRKSAFLNFIEQAHPDTAYVKSASYLMHEADFSAIRNLLLADCSAIVQDDSGIPIKYFDPQKWKLRLYGVYAPPLDIFKKYDQPDMAALFSKTKTAPMTFGAGYHWDAKTANLLVAVAKSQGVSHPAATPVPRPSR